ncbi:hypothetical protein ACD591_20040 [Rufibacter glacialis]|uniref:Uncharacterized protein n=1 Tax=Rufibacter glacialis TaxID=1259555 RepID=A0A5M8Q5L2_9BACT|nr:hypothetical protein [Rufibacter glacialis]KAA6430633.1 hypothetical protein FOE74_19350 [Rufibacter glacialis]
MPQVFLVWKGNFLPELCPTPIPFFSLPLTAPFLGYLVLSTIRENGKPGTSRIYLEKQSGVAMAGKELQQTGVPAGETSRSPAPASPNFQGVVPAFPPENRFCGT